MRCRAAISALRQHAADVTQRSLQPELRSFRVRRITGSRAREAPDKRHPSAHEIVELRRLPDAKIRRRGFLITLVSVLVIGIGVGWFAAVQWGPFPTADEQPQVSTVAGAELTPVAQPEVPSSSRLPALMQRDGMYLVGTDVAPGRYVATGTGSACYYAAVSDLSGSLNAVVTTHFGDAWGRRVELDEGEYFETDACGSWLLESPN